MREILFRGKREDNGVWVVGDLIYRRIWKTDVYVIRVFDSGFDNYEEYDVIPETVGQYTGLTDKNGKEIFEGDIVAGALHWQERRKNGIVAFRNGSFGLLWYRGEIEQFNPFTSMCNVEYEVIGNVQENPELMRGEEE